MSKKYDEYMEHIGTRMGNVYPYPNLEIPMVPVIDAELDREIRDRAIIEFVKVATQSGVDVTYGDIRAMIDCDPSEKEYENSKADVK